MPLRPAPDEAAPRYSVVVPVYRNAATLPDVLDRLLDVASSLPAPLEVVFVVDGSPDDSAAVLRRLAPESPLPVRVAELSRNFGSFSAIRTGMQLARGQ